MAFQNLSTPTFYKSVHPTNIENRQIKVTVAPGTECQRRCHPGERLTRV